MEPTPTPGGRRRYRWNDITLTPQQIAQTLWQAGIHEPSTIAQLIPIAIRESGGEAGIHGTDRPQNMVRGDRGLFQINWTHDDTLRQAGIISNPADLFNPLTNARAAAHLIGTQGGGQQGMLELWGWDNGQWAGLDGTLPTPNKGFIKEVPTGGLLDTGSTATTPAGFGGRSRGSGGSGGSGGGSGGGGGSNPSRTADVYVMPLPLPPTSLRGTARPPGLGGRYGRR